MALFLEKPAIVNLQVEIKPDEKSAFVDWQADFNSKIAGIPGFVSLEFSSPDKQNKWMIVQRFTDFDSLKEWSHSECYEELVDKLKTLAVNGTYQSNKLDDKNLGNVTEVIVTEVSPGMEEEYRAWSAKIHRIEAKFPGFRGVYIQPPSQRGKHWITLLQFDTMENLDHWLQSPERKQILQESAALISSLESHRVISPYAGWFASIAKTGELPSVWKQTMLVLLVLFPIVMLELKFLSPLTSALNPSVATFIGNAISVTLISFPMMPIAIYFLGWWLSTHKLHMTIGGTFFIGILYLIEIILFWNIL